MSLRRKNLVVIISTLIALVIILFVLSQYIILKQFDQQQQETVLLNMDRALNAFDVEIENLSIISRDWAYWDETYKFVQTRNETYITSNLTDESLQNLQLDFMLFVNLRGEVVTLKSIGLPATNDGMIIRDLAANSEIQQTLFTIPSDQDVVSGIIVFPETSVEIVSRAIFNSQQTGSPAGVLIIGRHLTQTLVTKIAKQTQLVINLKSLYAPEFGSDFTTAKSTLLAPDGLKVAYISKDRLAQGYALLNDITGQPAAILQIEIPNRILQAGKQAVLYILMALLISGLVFGAVIIWLMERIIISRLAYMDRRVFEIGNTDDLSARIVMPGNDELARLAATINTSLAKREQSQEEQLKQLNAELIRVNDELKEKIVDIKANQKYKDRFFAHASHEFRTPLAILRTRLYLARRKPEDWEIHVDSLENTVDHLINIIDDIFDMTKLQDHNLTLNVQSVDFNDFVTLMIELQTSRANDIRLTLQNPYRSEPLLVRIDAANFGRAFAKTMKYILDFSKPAPDNEIVLEIIRQKTDDNARVSLLISNCGLRFDENEIPEMFSPFFQVSEGNVRNTGLNMAIARRIIELHQGTLTTRNDPDKGGCFEINMPLWQSPN